MHETRKGLAHRFLNERNLFPAATVADEAIRTVRKAVTGIYGHAGRPCPAWICDDKDRGWDAPSGFGVPTVRHQGAGLAEAAAVKMAIVRNGHEYVNEVLPPALIRVRTWRISSRMACSDCRVDRA